MSTYMELIEQSAVERYQADAERDALRARVAELERIRCPDGVAHRWDGFSQCKECGNCATDLIDAALSGREGE